MTKLLRLSGVVPALVSPLTDSGAANLPVTRELVRVMLAEGASGLYILGSTGMGLMLPEGVRQRLTEVVVEETRGRIPVIVHVGAITTAESIRLARHAASVGVDGVSSVAPVIGGGVSAIAMRHYRDIAAATDLPFVVYHLDGASSMPNGVTDFADMLLDIPNIAGIKMTSRDMHAMTELHALVGHAIEIYSGADELMCHAVMSGATAAIGTYYNVWMRGCSTAREAAAQGRIAEAATFMHAFRKAIAETCNDVWGFMRAALEVRYDIDVGPSLAPLGWSYYEWKKVDVRSILEAVDEAASALVR